MAEWRNTPLALQAKEHFASPAMLDVDVTTTGTVEIQRRNRADTGWTTIRTFNATGYHMIERNNAPVWQVIATGDAYFRWHESR